MRPSLDIGGLCLTFCSSRGPAEFFAQAMPDLPIEQGPIPYGAEDRLQESARQHT